MRQTTERTEHCIKQAEQCARAAAASRLADVRKAYLNLEQGWLQLAPELGEGGNSLLNEQHAAPPKSRASRRQGRK